MTTPTPSSMLEELNKFSPEELENDPKVRKEALAISRRLTSSLSNPLTRATEMAFSPFIPMVVRIAIDLDLFNLIAGQDEPITTAELAEKSGGEELLITRLLRLLAAVDFVGEKDADLWFANPTTKAMCIPAVISGHHLVWEIGTTPAIHAPKYLRETHHRSPTSPTDGLNQYAHRTKLSVFDYMNTQPSLLAHFNAFMGNTQSARKYWISWFPIRSSLLSGFRGGADDVLLVDVGGGKGHDIQAFAEQYPQAGKLVLQDLPAALDAIPPGALDASIERQVHDFFTPQPVRGARCYFLHHVLHDWADPLAVCILERVREAMEPGYSRLLIHELVLPDRGASEWQCVFDMTLMTFSSGIQRTRRQWGEVVSRAGLVVERVWEGDEDGDGIVECVRGE